MCGEVLGSHFNIFTTANKDCMILILYTESVLFSLLQFFGFVFSFSSHCHKGNLAQAGHIEFWESGNKVFPICPDKISQGSSITRSRFYKGETFSWKSFWTNSSTFAAVSVISQFAAPSRISHLHSTRPHFEISNEEKKWKFVGKWKWRKDKLGVSERCHFPPVLCSQTLRNSMLLDLTFHTFSHFHLSRLEFLLFNFFAKLIFSALIFGVTDFSSRVTMRS